MARKIQRRPIRRQPDTATKDRITPHDFSIWDAFTILGGVTGFIVAILWLAGRFYMAGYFSAMNIPPYQISYSIWEYAEVSWSRLIFYFLGRIYALLLVLATIFLAFLLLIPLLQRIFPKLKIIDAVRNIMAQAGGLRSGIRYGLIISVGIYFFYLLLLAFVDINKSGRTEGQNAVLTKSYAIEVYSKDNLPLGFGQVNTNTSPALIEYSGLRLLTYNNGKYYLFRDVDPVTCKPLQVFIIDDSQDTQFVIGNIEPIDAPCAPAPSATTPP